MIRSRNLTLVDARSTWQALQDGGLTVIECGWGSLDPYQKGHLPGAVYLDSGEFEADLDLEPRNWWNLRPIPDVLSCLAGSGISKHRTVFVYSRDSLAAARLVWVLLLAGHLDVRWLDGGLSAWQRAGFPLESGRGTRTLAVEFEQANYSNPEFCWSIDQVLTSSDFYLVDIRSKAEHLGYTSGYSYFDRAGHIPGSIWGGGGSDSNSLEDFFGSDGRLKPLEKIGDFWTSLGLTPEGQSVFYCGTGWRASVAFLCAYLLGWRNIAVLDGGWFEWSAKCQVPGSPNRTSCSRYRPTGPPIT